MSNEKISCEICGAQTHVMERHLKEAHPGTTIEQYQATYPGKPVLSQAAIDMIEKKRRDAAAAAGAPAVAMAATATVTSLVPKGAVIKAKLHEVFNLGSTKAALSMKGDPIMITTLSEHDDQEFVPTPSDNYVYNIDELKDVILALELNIPCYVWGHKGSGKSELFEQIAARTNRPQMRVQHTVNTEESHIVGQWTVKGGQTVFELGPLPLAMMNGFVYVADEYDFAQPSVLSVYQAVLEGKPLVIKEAPEELRVIRPHPSFRFVATGNTNGSGDETGLYQGTLIQNSANYDRFGMVIHKHYMDNKSESLILQNHCKLNAKDADKMVEFATQVREAFAKGTMSDTISPRTLIYASRIGVMRGSFRHGLTKAFINKLCKVDREVADNLAQRAFGTA